MNIKFNILFIASLLAIGCTKSEVIESKDGYDTIGFDTYVGREAQSKATSYGSTNLPAAVGVYGYYSGADSWAATDSPNLWTNLQLTNNSGTWSYDANLKKYWTNNKDNYTFLAYAPYVKDGTSTALVASIDATRGPILTYTVTPDIPNQLDVLYANRVDMQKETPVQLTLQHALSRLTVKASAETATGAYTYHVKEISVAGDFYTKGNLTLSNGEWENLETAATKENPDAVTTYTFFSTKEAAVASDESTTGNNLSATVVDYAIRNNVADNYLMIIPADFEETTTNADIIVTYTTLYGGLESTPKTVRHPITTEFEGGKAYAITLNFELNNPIQFAVDEESGVWDANTDIEIQQ